MAGKDEWKARERKGREGIRSVGAVKRTAAGSLTRSRDCAKVAVSVCLFIYLSVYQFAFSADEDVQMQVALLYLTIYPSAALY